MKTDTDILLTTYNGSRYLLYQINSLIRQNTDKWDLKISDDCSKDSTIDIIKKIANKKQAIVLVIQSSHVGIINGFNCLLSISENNYVMFCDQDDVWLPNKVEITLNKMLEMEQKYGKETPILIHTDLQVVDRNLNLINPSLQKHQNLDPYPSKLLSRLLVQNFVTGCTMMINKPLKDLITPIPSEAIMHDWWIALAAATLGKIAYIPEATILYRQHQENSIGAKKWGVNYILARARNIERIKTDIRKTIIQAKQFRETYQDKLNPEQLKIINTYIDLPNKNWLLRKYLMIKNGHFQLGKLKNLGFFAFM